jgi:hydroxypyruvate isomerase
MLSRSRLFLNRFVAAQRRVAGLEYLFSYGFDADELIRRLREHRLVQVLHTCRPATAPGRWDASRSLLSRRLIQSFEQRPTE